MSTTPAIRPEVKQHMTAHELSQTIEFGHLSPKMATWVLSYVQNFLDKGTFDPLTSTKAAYQCATEESARTFGYQLMAHPKILLTLNRFFGDSPEQAFLKQVEKAIYRRRLTIAQIRALELLCRVNGWANGMPHSKDIKLSLPESDENEIDADESSVEHAAQLFPIGAVIVQDGRKYQVKAEEIE